MSIGRVVASPQSQEAIVNTVVAATNSRTSPMRRASQPVSGSMMALLTANEVITHVPWFGLAARSPAIAGMDTLAMEVSSTCMKVPSDSPMVMRTSDAPVNGFGGIVRGLSVCRRDCRVPRRWCRQCH